MRLNWGVTSVAIAFAVFLLANNVTANGGFTHNVSSNQSDGLLDDCGWVDQVDIDLRKDYTEVTDVWTWAHVSGEANKDKCGFAGVHDGNTVTGTISSATRPDWIYSVETWAVGHVWLDNHYVQSGTVYQARNYAEAMFDTSVTTPVFDDEECELLKEDSDELWCDAEQITGDVTVTNQSYFSLNYKLYVWSFAGTNRPELEVFSETRESWGTGSLQAWDNIGGSPGTQIGATLYFDN
ncbi:MAG: hypothetical protein H6841_11015 [Planctomycetes bacterium]|nr:hypothetical protein [Planctomycetota bacterium]MCB9935789.1 hypothetical protein [Planctomycetota bacterium]